MRLCSLPPNQPPEIVVSRLSFRVLSRGIFISPHLLFGVVVSSRAGRAIHVSGEGARHASNPRSTAVPYPPRSLSPCAGCLCLSAFGRRRSIQCGVPCAGVVDKYSAVRDPCRPPVRALRPIYSRTSLYILPQITPRALFSNERVDVVLTSVTAGACPRSSRLLYPSRPYTMCPSRLPPSPRSLLIVHRRSSIVRYSSSPGKSVPVLCRRTSSTITIRVLYHGCPRLPLPRPRALIPAWCSMAARCKASESAVSAFDSNRCDCTVVIAWNREEVSDECAGSFLCAL